MGKDVIIACDFPSAGECLTFLDRFDDQKPFVKIGMELFYAAGPQIVEEIRARGHKIFLDLKLHDIPNTVMRATRVLSRLKVDMTNVHCGGGCAMMAAACSELTNAEGHKTILIGVTQLTSTTEETMHRDLLIERPMDEVVMHYAHNARESGLDGVVCSPLEAAKVKAVCGADFATVTPGIRFADGDVGDQARVTTPEKAKSLLSDYIVVGRPITQAADPVEAYLRCYKDFVG